MKFNVNLEITVTREDYLKNHPEAKNEPYISFEQYIIDELGWVQDSFSNFMVNSIEEKHDEAGT